jgi:hypothetical protein
VRFSLHLENPSGCKKIEHPAGVNEKLPFSILHTHQRQPVGDRKSNTATACRSEHENIENEACFQTVQGFSKIIFLRLYRKSCHPF